MKEGIVKIFNHVNENVAGSKSKTFLAFCFCFIIGVAVFSFTDDGRWLLYSFVSLLVVLFLIIILWHKRLERFLLFCFLFFILGVIRFLITIPANSPRHISYYNGSKMEITGWISAEPDVRISEAKYVLEVLTCAEGLLSCPQNVSGKILLNLPLYPRFNYGDHLTVACALQPPRNFIESNFKYDKYLAKEGIWSVCSNPVILDKTKSALSGNDYRDHSRALVWLKQKIFWLKSAVGSKIDRFWPEPESSFMAGLLYGSTAGMPKELMDNFGKTGITHIVAVSGFNITIIVGFLMSALILAGLYRRQAFWVVILFIFLFIIFTGATASVVRAGAMGVIVLVGQYLGRLARMGNALVFIAAIMVALNPYVLIWDAGFQLSFLATMGLVYLSPLIQSYAGRAKIIPLFIIENFSTTMSAIIATLPLILFQFGRLSVVAPLVNILVLWIIPWLMLFGFISIIFGFIFFPLGQVIAWIAGLGLDYVIMVVNWFGGKPWAAINVRVSWWVMSLLYLGIFYLIYAQNKNSAVKRGV